MDGEVIWEGPGRSDQPYPSMAQVRAWLADAGFAINEQAQGPDIDKGYAAHHVLVRLGR